jgi:hypothetical protein
MIYTMQKIKVPSLAVSLPRFGNTADTVVICLLLGRAVFGTRGLECGEVIDNFFVRLI